MKDDLQHELLVLQAAVEQLKGLEVRNTIRLLGLVIMVAAAVAYAFRSLQTKAVPVVTENNEPAMAPSDVDPSVAALDAANAAMAAAKAARPQIVVKYMPTLDDQFVDIKKRPLLSSYVLGDMFDMASVHPTTPDLGFGETATFKGLLTKPVVARTGGSMRVTAGTTTIA